MAHSEDRAAIERHVAFADALARWVRRAGVSDEAVGDLAVGFADTLHAAESARPELEALLALDPTKPADADEALSRLGYLNALLFTEMKSHIEDLERRWDELEARLLSVAPDEVIEGDAS